MGLIPLAGGHGKIRVALPVIRNAEIFHHIQGDVNIRPGHQVPRHFYFDVPGGKGRDEQDGGQKLAADIPGDFGGSPGQTPGLDDHRRAAIVRLAGASTPSLARASSRS